MRQDNLVVDGAHFLQNHERLAKRAAEQRVLLALLQRGTPNRRTGLFVEGE